MVVEDFDQSGTTEGADRQTITTTGWKTFALNATGLSWISKTGYTKLGLKTALDIDNTAPVDASNETGMWLYVTGYVPQLKVTHWGTSRYWVGKNGTTSNWSDRNNWADSSGGTGGAPVPTTSNNVYFDANSFSASKKTVTIDAAASCLDMVWTGATNSPIVDGSSDITMNGDITLIAGITWSHSGYFYLNSTRGSTFTSQAVSFSCRLDFNATGSSWTLGDNLTTTNLLYFASGTLDTNGKTVACAGFYTSSTNTRVLTLGASTINCSANWNINNVTNLTINANTSTINMTGNSTQFIGGGKTYNNVTLSGSPVTVTGSNTFATLAFTAGKQVNLTSGTTQTHTALTATGSAGNLITIHSTTPGSAATLSDAAGTNTCDFLSLKDITASGGAVFNPGDNSVDEGGNTGWTNTWTNPANAYSSNNSYATHTSPNGKLYVKLSKDAGATWTDVLEVTHTGAENTQTFGAGSTEKFGTTWTGDDIDNASFRVRVYCGASNSFNYRDYYNYGSAVAAGMVITGILVTSEGKWDGTTFSLDQLGVKFYYGNSPLQIGGGSIAYDSTTKRLKYFDNVAAAWKKCVSEDDVATTSAQGIAELATDAETLAATDTGRAVTPSNLGYIGAINGWIPLPTCTYASADDPTYTFTIAGDYTGVLSYGMRIKMTQSQAYTNDPASGANIELNMADTSAFTVGKTVTVSSSAGSETATVTVVHTNTHITVGALALNHTTTNPLVTITNYFKISATPTYAAPNTTVTVFGGALGNIANSAITSPAYSMAKVPYGFPTDSAWWAIDTTSTSELSQVSPTNGTWYNLGTLTISVPIGRWSVGFYVDCGIATNGVCRDIVQVALSTANNSASDPLLLDDWSAQVAVANDQTIKGFHREGRFTMAAKTTYYLISRQTGPTGGATCGYMWWEGQIATTHIWLVFDEN